MPGELTLPAGVPAEMATDPRMRAALPLLARGWALFVLGHDKRPLPNCGECPEHGALERDAVTRHDGAACGHLVCHGFYAGTHDPVRLAAMLSYAPDGLLALRTGKASRIAVVDAEGSIDEKTGLSGIDVVDRWHQWFGFDLPPTLMARTPSGGLHLFYALPDGLSVRSPQRVAPKVDLKADGGYVVIPPSQNRVWLNDAEPVLADGAVIGWMLGARGRRVESNGHGPDPVAPDDYDYATYIRDGCPAGVRDHFANDLAFRLRKGGVPRSFAEQSMRAHWERMEQPLGNEYSWQQMVGKLDHVFDTVEPEPVQAAVEASEAELEDALTHANHVARGGQVVDLEAELTHTGLGMRFARRFANRYRFVPGLGWHRWDGARWVADELNDALHATKDVLVELHYEAAEYPEQSSKYAQFITTASSTSGRAAMLTHAAVEPGMKVLVRDLNADPYQLVVRNGTLDLRTGAIRASDPDDNNTRCAAVEFDDAADCPLWREHVRVISAHADGTRDVAMEAYLQRWAGYTLTGLVSEQRFFFGYGEGGNGKNVFIETLLDLLGSYAKRGSTKLIVGGVNEHDTVIADLVGARMVFIDETPHGRINEARMKELTGTARIIARKIAKDPFEFDATFKLWMAGNNRPRVGDTSEGFWRRMDLVPFDAVIPADRRIRDYGKVLAEERSGILTWCLEGLKSYRETGGLGQPGRVLEAVEEYRAQEDIFRSFVLESFDVSQPPVHWQPNNVLHKIYVDWCEANGIRPLSMRALSSEWKRNGFTNDGQVRKFVQGYPGRTATQRGWWGPPVTAEIHPHLRWTAGF